MKIRFAKVLTLKKSLASSIGIGLLLSFVASNALAQYDAALMESSSVRVIAKGVGTPRASSGFLWQTADQVVTSLHAIPGGSDITVECRGVRKPATVKKTLAKADLILLHAPGLPSSCSPFTAMNKVKPEPFSTLYTYGYHAGAKSGTARKFEKGHANPERLNTLITGVPLQAIKEFGMPDTKLDIYYVQGGLLPGYSGGPVVNENKQLVGIVDGGLNKGASSYNWVIPAKYLDELTASNENSIPAQVAKSSERHFSGGIYEADSTTTVEFSYGGGTYSWVLTKTQSLAELEATADDGEGLGKLVNLFGLPAGLQQLDQLVFDIYQESNLGLILAVPAGQTPVFYARDEEFKQDVLFAENMMGDMQLSSTTFKFNQRTVYDDQGTVVLPSQDNFFNHLVTELLLECTKPGEQFCQLDTQTMRIIDFGSGNKILRMGVYNYDFQGNPTLYEYFSFGVKGDSLFSALTAIPLLGQVGLFNCLQSGDESCAGLAAPRDQLSQMIAAHLTSFTGLAAGADQRIVDTEFVYDNTWDNMTTWAVPYMDEENRVLFYNTRGEEWRYYFAPDQYRFVQDDGRDEQGNVTLKDLDGSWVLPISGGTYLYKNTAGDAVPVAKVMPSRQSWLSGYWQQQEQRFLFNGNNSWWYFRDGGYSLYQETMRYIDNATGSVVAVLSNGMYNFRIPIIGGSYAYKNPASEWVSGGELSLSDGQDRRVYFHNNQALFFTYLGGNRWRYMKDGRYIDVNEARRFKDAESGLETAEVVVEGWYHAIPLEGGQYYFAKPNEQYQVGGELVMYPIF